MAFKLLKKEGNARRGVMETVHGTIQTPVFMNVGTSAAIKGGISTGDLYNLGCQVELSNTYHLHIRPGDKLTTSVEYISFSIGTDPCLPTRADFRSFRLPSSAA